MSKTEEYRIEDEYKPTSPKDARFEIEAILHKRTHKDAYIGKKDINSLCYDEPRNDYNNLNCGLRIAYDYMGKNNPYKDAKVSLEHSPDSKPYKVLLKENPKLYKKLEEELKSMEKEAELHKNARKTKSYDYNNFCFIYVEIHEKDVQQTPVNADRFQHNYKNMYKEIEAGNEMFNRLEDMEERKANKIIRNLENIKPSEAIKLFKEAEKEQAKK